MIPESWTEAIDSATGFSVKLRPVSELRDWLKEAIPPIILTNMVRSRALKVCSGISPAFATVAASQGFPVFTTRIPGHVFNIALTQNGAFRIDLSAIQFEFQFTPNERSELVRLLKKVKANPFSAIKVEKLGFTELGNLEPPRQKDADMYFDPVGDYEKAKRDVEQIVNNRKTGKKDDWFDDQGESDYMSSPDDSVLGNLKEMPHLDANTDIEGQRFGLVDLRIEKYPIPQNEKAALLKAFHQEGLVARFRGNWIYFSPEQTISKATPEQVNSLQKLPNDWETYMVNECFALSVLGASMIIEEIEKLYGLRIVR